MQSSGDRLSSLSPVMYLTSGASSEQTKELGRLDMREVWPHQSCDQSHESSPQLRKLKYTEQEHAEIGRAHV